MMIDRLIEIDKALFLYLNNLGVDRWDPFWMFISDRTSMFFLISPIIIFYLIKIEERKAWLSVLMLIICISITDLIHVHLFKNLFMRLRPCWDPEISNLCRIVVGKGGLYGFVSGHAANTASIVAFFLITKKNNTNKFFVFMLLLWLVLVSYSRIYLGKHFPLDVICGIILGFLIALILSKLYKYCRDKLWNMHMFF